MTDEDSTILRSRKAEHVQLTVDEDVGIRNATNGFEDFNVIPRSIPNIDFNDISLKTEFLGHNFSAPVYVAGMSGGYKGAEKINLGIAEACQNLGIPMGVGSQRAMIVNPEMRSTFAVKDAFPDLFLMGNLGLVQFCMNFGEQEYESAVEGINADAMAIHLNAFQELCQPEGDLNFKGAWDKLEKLARVSKVPVIVKEVGSGMGYEEVMRMEKIGCAAVDIGGSGGTSWPKVELMRHDGDLPFELDDPILSWGVPTAIGVYEATKKSALPVIATGGMYDGVMAAKAMAMGANMVGVARPVIKAFMSGGVEGVEKWLTRYFEKIKRVMFLMGTETIPALRTQRTRLIPHGKAREWLIHRGIIK